MNLFSKSLAAFALCASVFSAHASVITFSGQPAKTFQDGTLSYQPRDGYDSGFYPIGGDENTEASLGIPSATIFFNQPVLLQSVTLTSGVEAILPKAITVSLFDSDNKQIGGQTYDVPRFAMFAETLSFDTTNVSSVGFSAAYDGDWADNNYQFFVKDVTYSLDGAGSDVPEPASMALLGLGACAFAASRRKRA